MDIKNIDNDFNLMFKIGFGFLWIFLFFSAAISQVNASVLSETALSMQPGEWKKLDAPIPDKYFITETRSGNPPTSQTLAQIDTGYWDPISKRVYFVGAGGGMNPQFVQYDELSNSWLNGPLEGFGGHTHGWDHNALDINNRKLFRAKYNATQSFTFDLNTNTWSENLNPVLPSGLGIINAFEYFPEMDGLLLLDENNEKIYILKTGSAEWELLLDETGAYGNESIMEYDPVHKIMYLGGGYEDGNAVSSIGDLFILTSDKILTKVRSAPVGFVVNYPNGEGSSNTVDPVTGNFLVFSDDGNLYEFDYERKSWGGKPADYPAIMGTDRYPTWATASIRIDTYGVIMFIKTRGETWSEAWLYKHSPSEPISLPTPPTHLSIITE